MVTRSSQAKRPARVAVRSAAAKPAAPKIATGKLPRPVRQSGTGDVLKELKSLAKELNKAAKGLEGRKGRKGQPKEISTVLVNVERMTADAATKSLLEAEAAQLEIRRVLDSLGRNWSREHIEGRLKLVNDHLTNIIVAQEFQDLAGQSIRQAIKSLVGAIIMVEGGGPTEERRLTQQEIDAMLQNLMP